MKKFSKRSKLMLATVPALVAAVIAIRQKNKKKFAKLIKED